MKKMIRGQKKHRVLIAEDSFVMRNNLRQIFEGNNFEVVAEATTGVQACHQYDHHLPDLVTMDINMPVMDGITALKNIIAKHPDARIIMVSAEGQKRQLLQALKLGAKHYLVKPINEEKTLTTVMEVINEAR